MPKLFRLAYNLNSCNIPMFSFVTHAHILFGRTYLLETHICFTYILALDIC